jgi:hypothetical protein
MNKQKLIARVIVLVVGVLISWVGLINFLSWACEEQAQVVTFSMFALKQIEDVQVKTVLFIQLYEQYQKCRGVYCMISSLNLFAPSRQVWDGYFDASDIQIEVYKVLYY